MLVRDILHLKGNAIFSIAPTGRMSEAVSIMVKNDIRYLPVLDGGQLLGVISFHDIAKAVIKETSFENRLLKRYIEHSPEEESAKSP